MASGSFSVDTSNQYVSGVVEWSSKPDTKNNRSSVTATMTLSRTNTGYTTWGTGDFFVEINGSRKWANDKSFEITYNSKTVMVSHTVNVTHNDNGEKKITIKWGGDSNVLNVYDESGSAVLDTIPRESSMTSSVNFTAGSNRTVTISRHSSSFRHEVEAYIQRRDGVYDWIKQIAFSTSETSKSTGFTTAQNEEIFRHLDGRASANFKMVLQTFSGSTHIGSKEYIGTVTAPAASTAKIDNPTGVSSAAGQGDNTVWIDQDIKISITRHNSGFTHKLVFRQYNTGAVIHEKTGVGTSYTWKPTEAEKNQMYNTAANTIEFDGQIDVYTYYSGELVRSATNKDINYRVRNSNPTFNVSQISYEDVNSVTTAVTGNNQYIIKNQSDLRVWVNTAATARNGATISRYEAWVNGVKKTITGIGYLSFGKVSADYNVDLVVRAVDSRGNYTEVKKTVTIINYEPPTLELLAERLNNFENQTTISASGGITSMYIGNVEKNTITALQYRFKVSTAKTWGAWTDFDLTEGGTNYYVEAIHDFDNTLSYNVEARISDKLKTTTYSKNVATGKPILFIDAVKKSIGLGDFPIGENEFFVNMAMMFGANKWSSGGAALDAGNSDFIGLNGLYFNDPSDNLGNGEGFNFLKAGKPDKSPNASDYYNLRVFGNGNMMLDNDIIAYVGAKQLWSGAWYLNANQEIPVSRDIRDCPNGWLLVWSDYDPAPDDKANDFHFVTTVISKWTVIGANGLANHLAAVPTFLNETSNTIHVKQFDVTYTSIRGNVNNDNSTSRQDAVLRKVYAF